MKHETRQLAQFAKEQMPSRRGCVFGKHIYVGGSCACGHTRKRKPSQPNPLKGKER